MRNKEFSWYWVSCNFLTVWQLQLAADIIQKLYLIAQELPPGDRYGQMLQHCYSDMFYLDGTLPVTVGQILLLFCRFERARDRITGRFNFAVSQTTCFWNCNNTSFSKQRLLSFPVVLFSQVWPNWKQPDLRVQTSTLWGQSAQDEENCCTSVTLQGKKE